MRRLGILNAAGQRRLPVLTSYDFITGKITLGFSDPLATPAPAVGQFAVVISGSGESLGSQLLANGTFETDVSSWSGLELSSGPTRTTTSPITGTGSMEFHTQGGSGLGAEILPNGDFEVNVTGWAGFGLTSGPTRVTTSPLSGVASMQFVPTGGASVQGCYSALSAVGSATAGTDYTASAKVKAAAGTALKIVIEFSDAAGTLITSAETGFTATGNIDTPSRTYTAPANTSRARVDIYTTAPTTNTITVDDVSVKPVTGGGAYTAQGVYSASTAVGSLTPGSTYRISAKVNAPNGATLKLGVEWHDSSDVFIDSSQTDPYFTADGTTQTISIDRVAPAGSSRAVAFLYTAETAQAITVKVDDFAINEVTTSGGSVSLSGSSIVGSTVELTPQSSLDVNETVTLDYTPEATPIKNLRGGLAAAISGLDIISSQAEAPPGGSEVLIALSGTDIGGWGTNSANSRATLAFFTGYSLDKWIREDTANALTWAHNNGLKMLIIDNGGSSSLTGDAVELGNEPYWGNVDPHALAVQWRNRAQAIRGSNPNLPIILPLLCFSGAGGGFNQFDNAGNYTYSGTTKAWVTWLNEGASDIWDYVDGYGIHPYNPYITTNSVNFPGGARFTTMNTVRAELEAIPAAAGKPFWLTEIGWATDGWHAGGDWYTNEANQAQWLVDLINGCRNREDVHSIFIYQPWDRSTSTSSQGDSEFHYGFRRYDESNKPSWAAVRALF